MAEVFDLRALVSADVSPFEKAMDSSANSVTSSLSIINAAANAYIGSGFIRTLAKATDTAYRFEQVMADISSISNVGIEKMANEIRNLDNVYGKLSDVANSAYEIISSGFDKSSAEVLHFQRVISTTAKTIRADIGATTNAMTTLANAYGVPIDQVQKLSDMLFVTVREGKANGNELARTLGLVSNTAAEAGVTLAEMTATIAVLSRTQSASQSMIAFNQMLNSLIKPTIEAQREAKKWGIEIGAAALQTKGFTAVLTEMHDKIGGNVEAINAILGNIRAMRAGTALTGRQFHNFIEVLREAKREIGTGVSLEAFAKQTATAQQALKNLEVQVDKTYEVIGKDFESVTKSLVVAAEGVLKSFADADPLRRWLFYASAMHLTFKAISTAVREMKTTLQSIRGISGGISSMRSGANALGVSSGVAQTEGFYAGELGVIDSKSRSIKRGMPAVEAASRELKAEYANNLTEIRRADSEWRRQMQDYIMYRKDALSEVRTWFRSEVDAQRANMRRFTETYRGTIEDLRKSTKQQVLNAKERRSNEHAEIADKIIAEEGNIAYYREQESNANRSIAHKRGLLSGKEGQLNNLDIWSFAGSQALLNPIYEQTSSKYSGSRSLYNTRIDQELFDASKQYADMLSGPDIRKKLKKVLDPLDDEIADIAMKNISETYHVITDEMSGETKVIKPVSRVELDFDKLLKEETDRLRSAFSDARGKASEFETAQILGFDKYERSKQKLQDEITTLQDQIANDEAYAREWTTAARDARTKITDLRKQDRKAALDLERVIAQIQDNERAGRDAARRQLDTDVAASKANIGVATSVLESEQRNHTDDMRRQQAAIIQHRADVQRQLADAERTYLEKQEEYSRQILDNNRDVAEAKKKLAELEKRRAELQVNMQKQVQRELGSILSGKPVKGGKAISPETLQSLMYSPSARKELLTSVDSIASSGSKGQSGVDSRGVRRALAVQRYNVRYGTDFKSPEQATRFRRGMAVISRGVDKVVSEPVKRLDAAFSKISAKLMTVPMIFSTAIEGWNIGKAIGESLKLAETELFKAIGKSSIFNVIPGFGHLKGDVQDASQVEPKLMAENKRINSSIILRLEKEGKLTSSAAALEMRQVNLAKTTKELEDQYKLLISKVATAAPKAKTVDEILKETASKVEDIMLGFAPMDSSASKQRTMRTRADYALGTNRVESLSRLQTFNTLFGKRDLVNSKLTKADITQLFSAKNDEELATVAGDLRKRISDIGARKLGFWESNAAEKLNSSEIQERIDAYKKAALQLLDDIVLQMRSASPDTTEHIEKTQDEKVKDVVEAALSKIATLRTNIYDSAIKDATAKDVARRDKALYRQARKYTGADAHGMQYESDMSTVAMKNQEKLYSDALKAYTELRESGDIYVEGRYLRDTDMWKGKLKTSYNALIEMENKLRTSVDKMAGDSVSYIRDVIEGLDAEGLKEGSVTYATRATVAIQKEINRLQDMAKKATTAYGKRKLLSAVAAHKKTLKDIVDKQTSKMSEMYKGIFGSMHDSLSQYNKDMTHSEVGRMSNNTLFHNLNMLSRFTGPAMTQQSLRPVYSRRGASYKEAQERAKAENTAYAAIDSYMMSKKYEEANIGKTVTNIYDFMRQNDKIMVRR